MKIELNGLYKFKSGIGKMQDVFKVIKVKHGWGVPSSYIAEVVKPVNRSRGFQIRIDDGDALLLEKVMLSNLPYDRKRIVYGRHA